MSKRLYKKIIFHCIFQFMIFKNFQNCLHSYQRHHTTFHVKKIIQLNILINIISPLSYDMDCDVGFYHFKSSICYGNSKSVATPLWPSVGVKPNTWKSWRLGVFRDSRMFRARQQEAKHLTLGCSWCHWKGLET